eukprot:406658-Pyramimonas_sp.AAC.1
MYTVRCAVSVALCAPNCPMVVVIVPIKNPRSGAQCPSLPQRARRGPITPSALVVLSRADLGGEQLRPCPGGGAPAQAVLGEAPRAVDDLRAALDLQLHP